MPVGFWKERNIRVRKRAIKRHDVEKDGRSAQGGKWFFQIVVEKGSNYRLLHWLSSVDCKAQTGAETHAMADL